MSDLATILVAVVAATPAVVASYFAYRTASLARETRDTIKAAAVEAPTSLTGERRVMLRTAREEGATPTQTRGA